MVAKRCSCRVGECSQQKARTNAHTRDADAGRGYGIQNPDDRQCGFGGEWRPCPKKISRMPGLSLLLLRFELAHTKTRLQSPSSNIRLRPQPTARQVDCIEPISFRPIQAAQEQLSSDSASRTRDRHCFVRFKFRHWKHPIHITPARSQIWQIPSARRVTS